MLFPKRLLFAVLTVAGLLLPALVLAQPSGSVGPFPPPPISPALNSDNLRVAGQLGGTTTSIAVQGNYAYAAIGMGLAVLDVSNPAIPVRVGFLPLRSIVNEVEVSGNYAYLATVEAGLRIVDISNPSAPVEISSYQPPSHTDPERGTSVEAVTVAGNHAYLGWQACQLSRFGTPCTVGLAILDLSNPASPAQTSVLEPDGDGGSVNDIALLGEHLYLLLRGTLLTVNVSNPSAPVVEHNHPLGSNTHYSYRGGIAISGNHAYVSTRDELQVYNLSTPAAPTRVGAVNVGTGEIAIVDNLAYVAGTRYDESVSPISSGLWVVDIADPHAPTESAFFNAPVIAVDVAVAGSHAYLADQLEGVLVVNISNPSTPTESGTYNPPRPRHPNEIVVNGDYGYIADSTIAPDVEEPTPGLLILDLTDPALPVVVGSIRTPFYIGGLTVAGNYVYLGAHNQLRVIDVSNPTNPTEAGSYTFPDEEGAVSTNDVAIAGDYAYVTSSHGLRVIDVSNPDNMHEVGRTLQGAGEIAISGGYAYLSSGSIRIVDISTPTAPVVVGEYFATHPVQGSVSLFDVAVAEGRAYATYNLCYLGHGCFDNGLDVVDVTEPLSPTRIGLYNAPSWPASTYGLYIENLAVSGAHVYLATHAVGLLIVDVSDPASPRQAGYYDTNFATGVQVANDRVYVADREAGLLVLAASGSVQGKVTHPNGTPVEGVTIHAGESQEATTDSSGTYILPDVSSLSVTLTPSLEGYSFTPPTRTVGIFEDVMNASFVMVSAPVSTTLTPNNAATLSYN
ncbi:MAG TPA: carboxypeptidase regulatory-like domain-containing protein, partial [Ardenticatenaceae bacterium]